MAAIRRSFASLSAALSCAPCSLSRNSAISSVRRLLTSTSSGDTTSATLLELMACEGDRGRLIGSPGGCSTKSVGLLGLLKISSPGSGKKRGWGWEVPARMPELRNTGSRYERGPLLGGSSPPSSSSLSLTRRRLRLRLSALLGLFRTLPVSSEASSSASTSFVARSFSLPLINAGGSISSSSHTVRKSVKVNAPLGVSLNSFRRLRNVVLKTVYYIICHKLIICCNAIPMCQLFCL